MPDTSQDDLHAYGDYLKSQGHNPNDIAAYLDYAAQQHGVSPGKSWLDASVDLPLVGETSVRGMAQGAIDSLPAAGAMAGGVAGGLAGLASPIPGAAAMGAVGLAAAGGAAGESLRTGLNTMLNGEQAAPKDRTELYTNIAEAAKTGAEGEMTGQIIPAVVKQYGAKALSAITGTAAKDIQTYAQDAAKINDMAAAADGNVAVAANNMKEKFAKDIDSVRTEMNASIAKTLSKSDARVPGSDILDALKSAKGTIDADLHPEQLTQVDDLMSMVRKKFDENGQIFASDANNLKRYLQDQATEAYRKPGEAQLGTQAAQAAKKAAAITRGLVNQAAPEVAHANEVLAGFHELEDTLNSNLLAEGKNYASLIAAGRGNSTSGLTNAENLKALSKLTGTDLLKSAEELSAMDTFMGPKAGEAGRGKIAGAMVGAAASHFIPAAAGPGAAAGYYLGGAVTSPSAVKSGLNAALPAMNMIGGSPAAQSTLGQSVVRGSQGVQAIMGNKP